MPIATTDGGIGSDLRLIAWWVVTHLVVMNPQYQVVAVSGDHQMKSVNESQLAVTRPPDSF